MGLNVTKEENLAVYNKGMELMQKACSYQEYINAAEIFESIKDYEDSSTYAYNCRKQAVESRNSMLYLKARNEMDKGDAAGYSTALHYLKEISGWKDADDLIMVCQEMFNKLNNPDAAASNVTAPISATASEEEDQFFLETQNNLSLFNDSIFEESIPQINHVDDSAPHNNRKPGTKPVARPTTKPVSKVNNSTKDTKNTKEKGKKKSVSTIVIIIAFASICIVGVVYLIFGVIKPMMAYDDAIALLEQGKYEEGYEMLVNIGREDVISQNKHERAQKAIEDKDYSLAVTLCTENNETDFLFGKLMTLYDKFSDEKNYHDSYAIISSLNGSSAYDNMRFDKASQYITDSFDDKAFILLTGLTSDNAVKLRNSISNIPFELHFIDAGVGDIVEFGRYELDSNPDNGKETLKWRIADRQDGKYLLICQSVVDCLPFNSGGSNYTWDSCTLRKIMNMSYLPSMFTDAERKIICETNTVAESNPESHVASGEDCVSSIFILSASEYEKYIGLDNAGSIDYAGYPSVGAPLNIWLRNPGAEEGTVSYVTNNGTINYQGAQASTAFLVLPAVWVKSTTI